METINNIANAASKAVFGEGTKPEPSTQEPRSGETGQGTPDSPYDKGNLDAGPASPGTDGASDARDVAAATGSTSSTRPTSASQPKDTTATQGSNVPTAEPNAEETAAIQEKKDNAEAALNKDKAPATTVGAADTTEATPIGTEPATVDATKPDAVKDAKAAAEPAKPESTTTTSQPAKGTPGKDSTKSKGSVREKFKGFRGKLPFGKKKSDGSASQG